MQIDTATMARWFDEFNRLYFSDRLPVPRFATGRSRHALGTMVTKTDRRLLAITRKSYTIRLSNYYDMPEKEFQNVLLHEMIHLYIAAEGLKDTSSHGRLFRREMQRINAFGWNIRVSIRTGGEIKARKPEKTRQRLVLALTLKDGRHVLSVVNPHYIKALTARLVLADDIKTYAWYVTSDAYFSGFPAVRSMKGRFVEASFFEEMVRKLTPLKAR